MEDIVHHRVDEVRGKREEDMEDVQIYVPRDSVVDPDESEDPTIGAGAPIRKRG